MTKVIKDVTSREIFMITATGMKCGGNCDESYNVKHGTRSRFLVNHTVNLE
jgi:hypothetical protein